MNTIGYLIMFQYTNTYFFGSDSLEQSWESPVSLNLAEFGTGASLRNIFICFSTKSEKKWDKTSFFKQNPAYQASGCE